MTVRSRQWVVVESEHCIPLPPISMRLAAIWNQCEMVESGDLRSIVVVAAFKKCSSTRPIFFQQSSCNRVDLLSYESKPTDKWEQYDWRAEKKLDGQNECSLDRKSQIQFYPLTCNEVGPGVTLLLLYEESGHPYLPRVKLATESAHTRQIFFLRSSRNRVDLLSYDCKTTDKRQPNDWMGGIFLDG